MKDSQIPESTDSWHWGKIIKHIILPKPKDAPKAGKKEISVRIGLAIIIGGLLLLRFFGGNSLPSCDSTETTGILKNIYDQSEYAKEATFVSVKEQIEQGFNTESEIRACSANLVSTKGPVAIQYSVKWQDKKAGTFWVEINSAN